MTGYSDRRNQMSATQIKHPWRATVRTAVAAVIAFAGLFPVLVDLADLPQTAAIIAAVTVTGAITRIAASPMVEAFLQQFVPWLSAAKRDEVSSEE